MCCREEPDSSSDDDLIPTSLEIGTKPLDLEGLVLKRLSGIRTSLRTAKFPPSHPEARATAELQALIDLQWSKASAGSITSVHLSRRAETTHKRTAARVDLVHTASPPWHNSTPTRSGISTG